MKAAAEPPSISPPGFPTWLPPMLVKELRQGIRAPGFVAAFMVFQLLMVLLILGSLLAVPSAKPADRAAAVASIDTFFWTLLGLLLLVFTPGRALLGLRAEIETRTLELLVLTRLSAWRIVLGKWVSLLTQAVLMFTAMLPYGLIRFFGGSVDLQHDGLECLLMLGGCAVLTAVALWASVLPRLAVGAVLLLLAGNQAAGGITLFGVTPVPVVPRGSLYALVTANLLPVVLGGMLVLVLSLLAAVRRISPPVENHAPLTRALALGAFAAVPFLAWAGAAGAAGVQFGFATAFLAVIAAVELADGRVPIGAHWESFRRHGRPGRMMAVLALPGWPSAAVFAGLMTALVISLSGWEVGGVPLVATAASGRFGWLVLLGFQGLLFPAVVRSCVPRAAHAPGRWYLLVVVLLSLLAVLSFALDATVPFYRQNHVGGYVAMVPVTGFWLTLAQSEVAPAAMIWSAGLTVLTLVAAAWQSRSYWRSGG